MKKFFLAFLMASIVAAEPLEPETSSRPAGSHPSVVQVVQKSGDFCTGFVVDEDLVATAAHCVDSDVLYVLSQPGGFEKATVRAQGLAGSGFDVALLNVETGRLPPMDLSPTDPQIGDSCSLFGFGGFQGLKNPTCQVVSEEISIGTSIILQGLAIGGDSGGPVINNKGEVIGVVWGSDRVSSIAMVPVEVLRKFISGELGGIK